MRHPKVEAKGDTDDDYHNVPPVFGREMASADFKFVAEYRLRQGGKGRVGIAWAPSGANFIQPALRRRSS